MRKKTRTSQRRRFAGLQERFEIHFDRDEIRSSLESPRVLAGQGTNAGKPANPEGQRS